MSTLEVLTRPHAQEVVNTALSVVYGPYLEMDPLQVERIQNPSSSTDQQPTGRNRSISESSRRPLAFDLATERKRVIRHGNANLGYFMDEVTSYLEEAYGKVGIRNYEHQISPDATGRERLWFYSGRSELAKSSYQAVVTDETLPTWYRERGERDILWVDTVEAILPESLINTRFIDLSHAPFNVPLEEREASGFGSHSFVRIHEIVEEGGQKKLVSKALRHYLALEEQEKLFERLTGKFISQGEILGTVEVLGEDWQVADIERIVEELYETTPQERRIAVPQQDLELLKSSHIKDILQKNGIQNWIRGIFTMLKNPRTANSDILQQFQGLEMAIQKLMDGEEVNLSVFENVDQSIFLSSDFRQSQSVRELTEVEYKPPACCDGIGSGFGASNISAPMMYQALAIMNTLSPQDGKDFSITCKLCKEVIMTVVHKGEPCPKCSRVRP